MEEELNELLKKRPTDLNPKAQALFNAIMKIADERDDLKQEINKLTAESTEWESKCYQQQEEKENLIKYLEEQYKDCEKYLEYQDWRAKQNVYYEILKKVKEGKYD